MQARIYKKTKSSMQSGPKENPWVIEFMRQKNHKEKEPVMGWVSSHKMDQFLYFPNLESAENYVKQHNFLYEIILPKERIIKPKTYAENFKHK